MENRRLLEHIGNMPPAKAEELYYAMLDDVSMRGVAYAEGRKV